MRSDVKLSEFQNGLKTVLLQELFFRYYPGKSFLESKAAIGAHSCQLQTRPN